MGEAITHVGLDAHKKFINAAILLPGKKEAAELKVMHEARALKRFVRKLEKSAPGEIRCCYEAGVCGFALARKLESMSDRLICEIIAPSLIPSKPGDRIKTDRKDACKLAELFRADLLTRVHPPNEGDEAVRDLCRCHDHARDDILRARHRLSKWLLRRGFIYEGGTKWTRVHKTWLRQLDFEHEADRRVFEAYFASMEQIEERLKDLKEHIGEAAQTAPYAEAVALLRCFRGIDTLTAMTIVAELHDFGRFESPRALMGYLGLVPSERSSGGKENRGRITKAGNKHLRRILTETAKHYRHRPSVTVPMKKRQKGQPKEIVVHSEKAQSRLHRKYWRLVNRGAHPNKATTAVARELVGFIWAVLYPRAGRIGPGLKAAA